MSILTTVGTVELNFLSMAGIGTITEHQFGVNLIFIAQVVVRQ